MFFRLYQHHHNKFHFHYLVLHKTIVILIFYINLIVQENYGYLCFIVSKILNERPMAEFSASLYFHLRIITKLYI